MDRQAFPVDAAAVVFLAGAGVLFAPWQVAWPLKAVATLLILLYVAVSYFAGARPLAGGAIPAFVSRRRGVALGLLAVLCLGVGLAAASVVSWRSERLTATAPQTAARISGSGGDAQGGSGGGDTQAVAAERADGDTVRKTFHLELRGEVPDDQGFALALLEQGDVEGSLVVFCGKWGRLPEDWREHAREFVSEDACEGGRTYTYTAEYDVGAGVNFVYERSRLPAGDDSEGFFTSFDEFPPEDGNIGPEDYETLNADTVTTGTYTFGADGRRGGGESGDE